MSTLFIVPCDAAATRSGTTCASAPKHTSATRWLTSTLPAPTATGGTAATIEPAGAITCTGRNAPPFAGIVEEAWPSGEHIIDPMLFYRGDGDHDRMNANLTRMITDIGQFIDLDAMRNNTMSEWILKSLIPGPPGTT